jgi:hypothetical protein
MQLNADPKAIAIAYAKGWLPVDLISSIPIDFFLSLALQGCSGAPESGSTNSSQVTSDGCSTAALFRAV